MSVAVGSRAARRQQERHLRAVGQSVKPVDIGVCSNMEARYTDFFLSLEGVRERTVSILHWIRGADIPTSRNTIAARSTGDYVWFIDDDHTFPADTLERLVARNVPIVAPLVLMKRTPFRPACFTQRTDDGYIAAIPDEIPTDGSLLEVEAVGGAGMLVHRSVFDAMESPWFEAGKIDGVSIGEDLHFCAKAKEAGFPVYVDPTVMIGHLAPASIVPALGEDGWQVAFEIGGASFAVPA